MTTYRSTPFLNPGETRVLSHDFAGTVSGTPSAQLYVDEDSVGGAVNGELVSGSRWKFSVPISAGVDTGKSARIQLSATVDGSPEKVEFDSAVGVFIDGTQMDRGFLIKLTIKRADGTPVPYCECVVTTSSAGPGNNAIRKGHANDLGVWEPRLPAGTYYLWRDRRGVSFSDPATITISEAGGVTVS